MTTPMVDHGSTAATGLNSWERRLQPSRPRVRGLGALFLALACLTLPSWVSAQMVCTRLHSFGFAERSGAYPEAAVVQGRDGAFYGTTSLGGSPGAGTVFKLNPDGTGYTILHNFAVSSAHPGRLIQGAEPALYGTTERDGSARTAAQCSS